MKARHTVTFTFYENTTNDQIADAKARLEAMGQWLIENVGVTGWVLEEHITETARPGRAHLLQDCIFPSIESLSAHAASDAHKHVVELTPKISDWMTVDTPVRD